MNEPETIIDELRRLRQVENETKTRMVLLERQMERLIKLVGLPPDPEQEAATMDEPAATPIKYDRTRQEIDRFKQTMDAIKQMPGRLI